MQSPAGVAGDVAIPALHDRWEGDPGICKCALHITATAHCKLHTAHCKLHTANWPKPTALLTQLPPGTNWTLQVSLEVLREEQGAVPLLLLGASLAAGVPARKQ